LQLTGFTVRNGKGVAEGGVEAWPLSLNDRPLTLSAGLAQIDVGLLTDLDRTGQTTSGSTAFSPAVRYGLTDRATIALSAPGVCMGSGWCARYSGGAGAELALGVLSAGPTDFAVAFGAAL